MDFLITEFKNITNNSILAIDLDNDVVEDVLSADSILNIDNLYYGNLNIFNFICNPNFNINKVARLIGDNETYIVDYIAINEKLVLNVRTIRIVRKISIVDNNCILYCSNENNTDIIQSINLNDAVKYRETPDQRETINPFPELQQQIEQSYPRLIRLPGVLKRRRETLQEFLTRFFKEWNAEKDTIYVDDSTIQTARNKRRSLGDIYMICKYYYPTCTLQEVVKLLYVTLPLTITTGFRSSKCNTIHKRVWYYTGNNNNDFLNKEQTDEYAHNWQWYINNLR